MINNRSKAFIFIILSSILFLPEFMFPYLDPGTGSYVIQVILAGILGVGVAVKLFWGKIKQLFVKKKPIEEKDKTE
jgi:hypothetical protein